MVVEQYACHELMSMREHYTFIDVRSPAEFARGHIPGAHNIALFSDHVRALVGTCYVQQGREPAMHMAMQHIGPQLDGLVQQAQQILFPLTLSPELVEGSKGMTEQTLCVYCARGGMRSASVSNLFALFKLPVVQMVGGYKAFRNWVLEQVAQPRSLIVVSGKTGAGKTDYLRTIAKNGQQIIDLEALARHKGSVFGGTRDTQATQQQFENDLAWRWSQLDAQQPVFVEDESRKIGAVIIPEPIWTLMQQAPIHYLDIARQVRFERIMAEYGVLDQSFLLTALTALEQQLGSERYNQIVHADRAQAATLLLDYYDAKYEYQLVRKSNRIVKMITMAAFIFCLLTLSVSALQDARNTLDLVSRDGAVLRTDAALWRTQCSDCVLFEGNEPQTTWVPIARINLRFLNTIMLRLEQEVSYSVLIDELQHCPTIVSLFECAMTQLMIEPQTVLFHVLAQAYVRKMVSDVRHEMGMFSSFGALCAYFEHCYSRVAASLNMYVYLTFCRAEREIYNVTFLQYINVKTFLEQLPKDMCVVQFVEHDELSEHFARLRDMQPSQLATIAYGAGYLPFIKHAKYSASDVQWACVLQDVARVKEVLSSGSTSALKVLKFVFRLCPTNNPIHRMVARDDESEIYYITYPPDPIHDEVCRLVLKYALAEDEDALYELLYNNSVLRARAESLMPDLAELFLDYSCTK